MIAILPERSMVRGLAWVRERSEKPFGRSSKATGVGEAAETEKRENRAERSNFLKG
jgi:hypothetical protein